MRLSVDTLLKVRDTGTLTLKESCCVLPVREVADKMQLHVPKCVFKSKSCKKKRDERGVTHYDFATLCV